MTPHIEAMMNRYMLKIVSAAVMGAALTIGAAWYLTGGEISWLILPFAIALSLIARWLWSRP